MIIATALKELFSGMELPINGNNREVQYHYGDQKELLLWIRNRGNQQKYPLIWYVLNRYTEFDGRFTVDARIVLMELTRVSELNTWRSEHSYFNILQPLSDKVTKSILRNPFITVYGQSEGKFQQRDEPKSGLPRNNDESAGSNKSISTDFVDAKILTFKMEIKPHCIIK